MDTGEKVVPNTNEEGTFFIKEQIHLFRTEYDRLRSGVLEAKSDLESTLTQWSSFDHACAQLSGWLREVEVKLRSDTDAKSGLAEKKGHLEKVRMLAKDVALHEPQVRELEERCSQLQEPHASDMLTEVTEKYATVIDFSQEAVGRLETEVADHEAYKVSYHGCFEWVTSTRQKLQKLADAGGSKSDVMDRLEQLEVRCRPGHPSLTIRGRSV